MSLLLQKFRSSDFSVGHLRSHSITDTTNCGTLCQWYAKLHLCLLYTVWTSLQSYIYIYCILCRLGYKTAFIFTIYCLYAIFNLRLLLGFIAELYLNLLYIVSASLQNYIFTVYIVGFIKNYNYISCILCLGHLQIQAQADSPLHYKDTWWSKRFLNLLLFDHSSLFRTHYRFIKSFAPHHFLSGKHSLYESYNRLCYQGIPIWLPFLSAFTVVDAIGGGRSFEKLKKASNESEVDAK